MQTAHSLLAVGNAYSKKDLSEIFEDDNIATVREGRYSLKKNDSVLLFVDLIKTGKEERFHFDDYFVDGFFHWDSQTTQHINSPTIQSIVHKRVEVNLFCRIVSKVKGVTQPFYYCGRLEYVDHDPNTKNPVHLIYTAVDYDENTSNPHLIELYRWEPELVGRQSSNYKYESYRYSNKRQKKPNYTERRGLVTSRVGQGYYRQEILSKWNNKCALTGCSIESILISSHIKRWSESSDDERLDVNNGILLSPNIDALFDEYLISFTDSGDMLMSTKLTDNDLIILGVSRNLKLTVDKAMLPYLAFHRKKFYALDKDCPPIGLKSAY